MLSDFAVQTRYPGVVEPVTEAEYEEALEKADPTPAFSRTRSPSYAEPSRIGATSILSASYTKPSSGTDASTALSNIMRTRSGCGGHSGARFRPALEKEGNRIL